MVLSHLSNIIAKTQIVAKSLWRHSIRDNWYSVIFLPFATYITTQNIKNVAHAAIRRWPEIGIFRDFTKFTGKHLCQSRFFNKVANYSLQLYLKRDSTTVLFPWILQKILKHFLQNNSGRAASATYFISHD